MSFEEKLREATPTAKDLSDKAADTRKKQLKIYAENAVEIFSAICKDNAVKGNESCWCYATSSYNSYNIKKPWSDDTKALWSKYVCYVRLTKKPGSRTGYGIDKNPCEIRPKEKEKFIELLREELKNRDFVNATVTQEPMYHTRRFRKPEEVCILFKISTHW